jgi:hypothetical protein
MARAIIRTSTGKRSFAFDYQLDFFFKGFLFVTVGLEAGLAIPSMALRGAILTKYAYLHPHSSPLFFLGDITSD